MRPRRIVTLAMASTLAIISPSRAAHAQTPFSITISPSKDGVSAGDGIEKAGSPIFVLVEVKNDSGKTVSSSQWDYDESKTVTVSDPRPVAKAVQLLENVYGVPITYQDPIAIHESQLQEDVKHTTDNQVVVRHFQKWGSLSFTYRLPAPSPLPGARPQRSIETEAQVADALSSVLEGYTASGGPLNFTVKEEEGVFHIEPTNFVNKDGKLQQMVPILETRITILPKERTRQGLLFDICQSLTQSTGIPVEPGMFPFNGEQAQQITAISGSGVTALSLLSQMLEEWGAPHVKSVVVRGPGGQRVPMDAIVNKGLPMSWQLFYAPGFGYVLNIHNLVSADK